VTPRPASQPVLKPLVGAARTESLPSARFPSPFVTSLCQDENSPYPMVESVPLNCFITVPNPTPKIFPATVLSLSCLVNFNHPPNPILIPIRSPGPFPLRARLFFSPGFQSSSVKKLPMVRSSSCLTLGSLLPIFSSFNPSGVNWRSYPHSMHRAGDLPRTGMVLF